MELGGAPFYGNPITLMQQAVKYNNNGTSDFANYDWCTMSVADLATLDPDTGVVEAVYLSRKETGPPDEKSFHMFSLGFLSCALQPQEDLKLMPTLAFFSVYCGKIVSAGAN
jgi:hypothetical protein